MHEFLSRDGLEALFASLQRFGRKTPASLETALVLIHCVECLRAVMNCKTGLDHIVENERYTRELVQGVHFEIFFFFLEMHYTARISRKKMCK